MTWVTSLGSEGEPPLMPLPTSRIDQSVVPVAQVGEAVLDVDVVQRPARVGTVGLPLGHLARMIRIADVDHVHRAGAVVGEVDVGAVLGLAIDERAVDARRHAVGELGDHLGMGRVLGVRDHDAVLPVGRAFAGEDDGLAVRRRHHVVDAARVGDDRIGHHRLGRIADVDGEEHVAAAAAAEVGVLPVGMDPDFLGGEAGAREAGPRRSRDGARRAARASRSRRCCDCRRTR